MTRNELFALLRNPHGLSREHLPALRSLVDAYPYCASFVFLYLYALAQAEEVHYAAELRRLAIYLPTRERLYRLVEEVEVVDGPSASQGVGAAGGAFSIIDNFLREARASGEDLPEELGYDVSDRVDYLGASQMSAEHHAESYEALLSSAQPRSEQSVEQEDLPEELFTETLARIYIKQGRYDKALRIIRSISLNYPNKSRYFALQIRFLERLIMNCKESK